MQGTSTDSSDVSKPSLQPFALLQIECHLIGRAGGAENGGIIQYGIRVSTFRHQGGLILHFLRLRKIVLYPRLLLARVLHLL